MVRWARVCRSKRIGGLGIKDLHKQNVSLLVKWWWKLESGDGLWQRIVRVRYFKRKTVANVQTRFSDSPCWKAIMKVKEVYMAGRKIKINHGDLVRIWQDPWLLDIPLKSRFPILFDICQDQDCTLADFVTNGYEIRFRRRLLLNLLSNGLRLFLVPRTFPLNDLPDTVAWAFNSKENFTTKSVYEWLEFFLSGPNYKWVWKAKIPLKINFFLWQLFQNAALTRDNMHKRNWPGNPSCYFCIETETADHLFFNCTFARSVWGAFGLALGASCCPRFLWQCWSWLYSYLPGGKKYNMMIIAAICWGIWCTHNKVTFEGHIVRTPLEAVFTACSFMMYWAGLLKEGDKVAFQAGVKKMVQMAAALANRSAPRGRLLLEGGAGTG